MPKFRKKPVLIEALHFDEKVVRTGWRQEIKDAHPWLDAAYDDGILQNVATTVEGGGVLCIHIAIKTLEGTMRCDVGDWIIRGVKGQLYSCKPDIFAATYEPANCPPTASKENVA